MRSDVKVSDGKDGVVDTVVISIGMKISFPLDIMCPFRRVLLKSTTRLESSSNIGRDNSKQETTQLFQPFFRTQRDGVI